MKLLLFILSLGLIVSAVSADPLEPPEFVNCPPHLMLFYHCDSVHYTFEAYNPNHPNKCTDDCDINKNHCNQIRYYLIEGPGEINERTGEWFWDPTREDVQRSPYYVQVAAVLKNHSDDSSYCSFALLIRDRSPRYYIEDYNNLEIFHIPNYQNSEFTILIEDPDSCDFYTAAIDSLNYPFNGSVFLSDNILEIEPAVSDIDVRVMVWISLRDENNEQVTSSKPFLFDTRESPNPMILQCIESFETNACLPIQKEVIAFDKDSLENFYNLFIQYHRIEGPGYVSKTGRWSYEPQAGDIGQNLHVKIAASYGEFWSLDTCEFSFTIEESPLGIFMDEYTCGDTIDVSFSESIDFLLQSKNAFCDKNNIQISQISEDIQGEMWVNNEFYDDYSLFYFRPAYEDGGKNIEVTFGAKDGRDSIFCSVVINTAWNTQNAPYKVFIDTVKNAMQGEHVQVAVKIDSVSVGISGYDLLIGYDNSALSFQFANPGQFLIDCGWEYFTYRYGSNIYDSSANAPTGLLRLTSIAETNNGPNHPSCYTPNSDPGTLAVIDFLIPSNNNEIECTHQPIKFFWFDCGDNSLADINYRLFVSEGVYDYADGNFENIADTTSGFPTFTGAQPECFISVDGRPTPLKYVDFYNGFIDIHCPDTVEGHRIGDVNMNWVYCEIADLVLFSNYFVYGPGVFTYDPPNQQYNTDMNQDSTFLTIEDFVLLKRCMTGETESFTEPLTDTLTLENIAGEISFTQFDSLGALYFEVDGAVNAPEILLDSVEVLYNYDGQTTRFLFYQIYAGKGIPSLTSLARNVLGNIIDAKAADVYGRKVAVQFNIMTDAGDGEPDLPSSYALAQNYPNPFNNSTVIHFDLPKSNQVSFEIFNILGETVYSIDNYYSAGSHTIYWDGKNSSGSPVASGLYYYRIEASDFVDSKKMMLLK